MSDGPHRSLPLRPRWKRVAECADKEVYLESDAGEWLNAAIHADFSAEVSDRLMNKLRSEFYESDQTSFLPSSGDSIEGLRSLTNGNPLANLLVDCAIMVASEDKTGEAAFKDVLVDTTNELVARNCRGMEEHYFRNTGAQRATHFKNRINSIHQKQSIATVIGHLINGTKASLVRRPQKQTGLDEGVGF